MLDGDKSSAFSLLKLAKFVVVAVSSYFLIA